MPQITQLDNDPTPNNNDLLVTVDMAAGTTKNISRDQFFTGAPLPADTVDSQAIADGAIAESGTNSAGRFTKFHDGTMICTGAVESKNYSFNDQTVGNLMRGARIAQAFPTGFIAAPSLTMTPHRIGGSNELYFMAQGNTPRPGSFDWTAIAGSTTARDIGFTWTAIGRWK